MHLASLLIEADRGSEAVEHLAHLLAVDPSSVATKSMMARALGTPPPVLEADEQTAEQPHFDWGQAETEVGDLVPPMFADSSDAPSEVTAYDVERSSLTLADVGGMEEVKRRLNAAFLAPMRNEKLRVMYRKSLRGGLMLYGPPGCGKTFIARALAGELGAQFLTVSMAQILDMWIGNSEKNVHELFEVARANSPCVVFLDEVDAIGHKRSRLSSDGMRSAVNQLLLELDSVASDNAGVFVLAATNHPWDVDAALRRPGRLDRTLLVLPPDMDARIAIWRYHLSDRPIAGIDLKRLAKSSDGYSGADIAHACDSAAEIALIDSVESDEPRLITQEDVEAALREIRPSVSSWSETARNVALFANDDGTYDELATYLRKKRRL